MRKLISIGKVLLLTLLLVLGTTNVCFADIYVSPTENFIVAIPVLGVILAILGVLLVIALVCMIIAKVNDSEELLNKSKNICENLLYYILFIIGLVIAIFALEWIFILGILPLIVLFVSLFLRLKSKNKKASYTVLGIYLGLMLLMLLPELKYYVLINA